MTDEPHDWTERELEMALPTWQVEHLDVVFAARFAEVTAAWRAFAQAAADGLVGLGEMLRLAGLIETEQAQQRARWDRAIERRRHRTTGPSLPGMDGRRRR